MTWRALRNKLGTARNQCSYMTESYDIIRTIQLAESILQAINRNTSCLSNVANHHVESLQHFHRVYNSIFMFFIQHRIRTRPDCSITSKTAQNLISNVYNILQPIDFWLNCTILVSAMEFSTADETAACHRIMPNIVQPESTCRCQQAAWAVIQLVSKYKFIQTRFDLSHLFLSQSHCRWWNMNYRRLFLPRELWTWNITESILQNYNKSIQYDHLLTTQINRKCSFTFNSV